MKILLFLVFTITSLGSLQASTIDTPKKKLYNYDLETMTFTGLTPEGVKFLKEQRDAIRQRFSLFAREFKQLNAIHFAATVARLAEGHAFLYGPPGGAKSAFVNWMLSGESGSIFKLQLHQMMTETPLIGGQILEEMKKGKFEINTKGTLADATVALLDELDKGNPAALSVLLSILNESQILAGEKVIDVALETMFSTSNANLNEIYEQFKKTGQGTTAPALLNRFHVKALIYNWLDVLDQAELDKKRKEERKLKALASELSDEEKAALEAKFFEKPKKVNWKKLRNIGTLLFEGSKDFGDMYNVVMNDLRRKTNEEVNRSEACHWDKSCKDEATYFPTTQYTERLRGLVPTYIYFSAFIDFLLSDLANDENIEAYTKKANMLDSDSLWRAHVILTTACSGSVEMDYDTGTYKMNFGLEKSDMLKSEAAQVVMIEKEHIRFGTCITDHVYSKKDKKTESFERKLFKKRSKHKIGTSNREEL
jgi:MoxR-like ATPase